MKPEEIKRILPNASKSFIHINGASQASVLERSSSTGSLAEGKAEESNPVFYTVCVTGYRVRLIDEDNLCEKYHVDALRYAGLIPEDSPDKAHIVVTQKKVAKKNQEKTLVEIFES